MSRWLPWIAGLVLVAGVIAFTISRIGLHTNAPEGAHLGKGPVTISKDPPTVKVSPAARIVAGKFILTTVGRKDLATGWNLITPAMKQACGCSRKEWLKGNINVVPFPAEDISYAPFKTDWSHKNDLGLEVALLSKSKRIKSQVFFIELKKRDGKWLVDYIAPRGNVAVPTTGNG